MIPVIPEVQVWEINKLLEKACRQRDSVAGRQLHSLSVSTGICSVACLGDRIIRMFTLCGSLLEASLAFCAVSEPSVYTWQAIISAHAHHQQSNQALGLYIQMKNDRIQPNVYIMQSILHACSNIGSSLLGRQIHNEVVLNAIESNVVIGSSIITMYGKCGSAEEALDVLLKLPGKNVVSWSALMAGYAQHDHGHLALALFERMEQNGIKPDDICFLSILKACASTRKVKHGRLIHDQIMRLGLDFDIVLGSALLDLYAKCGNLDDAKKVFYKLPNRDVVCWGALIAGYGQQGFGHIALELYNDMQQKGLKPNKAIFPCVLNACSTIGDIKQGHLIHSEIIKGAISIDVSIHTALIDMYAKCWCLQESLHAFNNSNHRDVAVWGALISGYMQHGMDEVALECYRKMQDEKIKPDSFIWSCMLKVCSNVGILRNGQVMHNQVIQDGLESGVVVGSVLVDLYAKCGCLEEALKVFDSLPTRNDVTWGSMLAAYVQQAHCSSAFVFFERMQHCGVQPNKIMLICMLSACRDGGASEHGKLIHDQIVKNGFDSDVVTGNGLLDMYCKGGNFREAQRVFDLMASKNFESWSVMVEGFSQYGENLKALKFLSKMLIKDLQPSTKAFVGGLKACSSLLFEAEGRHLHYEITSSELESDMVISNSLIDFYGKCRIVADARKVFDKVFHPDIVSWSSMISSYVQVDKAICALDLFGEMQQKGIEPNQIIFGCILRACQSLKAIEQGNLVHHQIIHHGLESNGTLANMILDMYSKCGDLEDARKIFDCLTTKDETAWGIIIADSAQYGNAPCALEYLKKMPSDDLNPKRSIFPNILKACAAIRAPEQGKLMHDWILRSGVELDEAIGSTLISMYSSCGNLKDAQRVFDGFSSYHPSSWGAMLTGYLQHGQDFSALRLFQKLQQQGFQPNRDIFLSILKACSNIGALHIGKLVHHQILRSELEFDSIIGTTLMLMYAKCGGVPEAYAVFAGLSNQDHVCLSAMIACYAQYGESQMAVQCSEDMEMRGLKSLCTDYACILPVKDGWGHIGEGLQCFSFTGVVHRISSSTENPNWMSVLLGHAGCLEEARETVESMPTSDPIRCLSLLTACRNFGNVEIGRQFFSRAVDECNLSIAVTM